MMGFGHPSRETRFGEQVISETKMLGVFVFFGYQRTKAAQLYKDFSRNYIYIRIPIVNQLDDMNLHRI